jgi:uncharacterized protein
LIQLTGDQLPRGVGVSCGRRTAQSVLNLPDDVPFVEVDADDFLAAAANDDDAAGTGTGTDEALVLLAKRFPVVLHGSGLSVASAGDLDPAHLRALRRLSDRTGCVCYSDYLAMTSVPGLGLGGPVPIWPTPEVLRITIDHVDAVQQHLGKPLLLQNVASVTPESTVTPEGTLRQGEFVARLVEATNCGIIADLTTLCLDAAEYGAASMTWLSGLPPGAQVQIRLAPEPDAPPHEEMPSEEVWSLATQICHEFTVRAAVTGHWGVVANLETWRATAHRLDTIMREPQP